jgi:type II secretory pathway pseudopilin PulG
MTGMPFRNLSRPPRTAPAFTLVETILVTVVGVVLLASATYVYQVAKSSAGTAKAKQKVVALQAVVEELATVNARAYPDILALSVAWLQKRFDAGASPWGGTISTGLDRREVTSAVISGFNDNDSICQGIDGRGGPLTFPSHRRDLPSGRFDVAPTPIVTPNPTDEGYVGMMQYARVARGQSVVLMDMAIQTPVEVSGYIVGVTGEQGHLQFLAGGVDSRSLLNGDGAGGASGGSVGGVVRD